MEALHHYGPWVLLVGGVIIFFETVFLRRIMFDWITRRYERQLPADLIQHIHETGTMLKRTLQKPFDYWGSIVFALFTLSVSAVWFALRP